MSQYLKYLIESFRHGPNLKDMTWREVYDDSEDFSNINMVLDLLLTLPPTSVSCETTFSQMKLIKTSRRTRLRSSTLNNLLLVKLESKQVAEFNPDPAVDRWFVSRCFIMKKYCNVPVFSVGSDQSAYRVFANANVFLFFFKVSSKQPRRLNYKRQSKESGDVINIEELNAADVTGESNPDDGAVEHVADVSDDTVDSVFSNEEEDLLDINIINSVCGDDDEGFYCLDFQDEEDNFNNIMMFSRSI